MHRFHPQKVHLIFSLSTSIVASLLATACQDGKALDEEPLVSGNAILIPGGQALVHRLRLEPEVVVTRGIWVHRGDGGHQPSSFQFHRPETLTSALELPGGSILVGDVVIPANVSLEPGSLLPGARRLDAKGLDPTTVPPALVTPPSATLTAEHNAIPAATLMTGAIEALTTDLKVPLDSSFPNGLRDAAGDVIANALPDPFNGVVATAEATLPSGTLVLGGVQLPESTGIWTEGSGNQFVGAFVLPEVDIVPAPGIGLPAGTQLDAAVLIPRGAAFLVDSTLPAQTQLGLGYVEPSTEAPPVLEMTGASTLGEPTLVGRGTALLGDALIPEGVGELAETLFLPAGTRIARGIELPDQQRLGLVVPPRANFTTSATAPSNLPAQTLLLGYAETLPQDLPIPRGTRFHGGYRLPDGELVQPGLAEAAMVLPEGSLLFAGATMPAHESGDYLTFEADLRIPGAAMIPGGDSGSPTLQGPNGLNIPQGSRGVAAMLMPRGAAFLVDSTLPVQTQLGLGYVEPPRQDPPELRMTGASTLAEATAISASTALLGEAMVPVDAGVLPDSLFLPAGTKISADLEFPAQQVLGMIVPPGSTFTTATFNPANLPENTLLLGYAEPTLSELQIPAGSEFHSGYRLPDGTAMPAGVSQGVTLPSGTLLLGGVALPAAETGNYLVFSSDLVSSGATMIPANNGSSATIQEPNGLTIPVGSKSITGTTGASPSDAGFGEVLGMLLDMPVGAQYCRSAQITDATGFAKITTAKIEYRISGEAQTRIDVATDFAFTDIVQTFNPAPTSGLVEQELTELMPETTYYFRVSLQGCGGGSAVIQGFRTTHDACGGEFELVGVGVVYDGWDGRFGTADESALHISQMKINPADDRLYIAASKQSDGTANLYRSTADFLGIEEAGLVVGNQAVRNSTAIGFQNFGDDFVYMNFKDNASRGFSSYRWTLGEFGNAISVASADGTLGGSRAADREGFGDDTNEWVTDAIGGALGRSDLIYLSTRPSGRLYMADGMATAGASTPGDAYDFTGCDAGMTCSRNDGAGAVWQSGTNNIGAMSYVDDGMTSGLFLGVGREGGSGATLAFMASSELGSSNPTITPLAIAGLNSEIVVDIALLNEDLVFSTKAGTSGGQAWICRGRASNDCSDGANWVALVDFADGTGLSTGAGDAGNVVIRWLRQMPNSGTVYLGTENSTGAQIWSAPDNATAFSPEPSSGCGGLGNANSIASPTAQVMHNATRNVDILYLALHQFSLYQQADAAPNNVFVYRRLEQL